MQKLYLLAAQGHELSAEDKASLKSWYETLDREEAVINRNSRQVDVAALKKKVEKTTKQITRTSDEITALLRQNEQIRLENKDLRRKFESRLVEQAA